MRRLNCKYIYVLPVSFLISILIIGCTTETENLEKGTSRGSGDLENSTKSINGDSIETNDEPLFNWDNTVAVIMSTLNRSLEEAEVVAYILEIAGVHGAIQAELLEQAGGGTPGVMIKSEDNKDYRLFFGSYYDTDFEDDRFYIVLAIQDVETGEDIYADECGVGLSF